MGGVPGGEGEGGMVWGGGLGRIGGVAGVRLGGMIVESVAVIRDAA